MSSGNTVEHTGPASAEAKIHARDSVPWFVSAQVISLDAMGKLTHSSRQDIGTGGLVPKIAVYGIISLANEAPAGCGGTQGSWMGPVQFSGVAD